MYDSLNKESAPTQKKFLTLEDWSPDIALPYLDLSDIIQLGYVYTPTAILEFLNSAYDCLTTYPGPNIEFRQMYAQPWIGWWINEFKNYDEPSYPIMKTYNIINFDKIADELAARPMEEYSEGHRPFPAVWFVAGLEGHEGSRFAINHIMKSKIISPIIVFEQDQYLKGKERQKPFLPLEVRLSMYSHFFRKRGNRVILSANWYSMFSTLNQGEIYDQIFKRLHAFICIPNAVDSTDVFENKARRSVFLPKELAIPHLDVPSTTERVRI